MDSSKITRPLKKLAIITALAGGLPLLWNYTHNHHVSIDTNHTLILRKMDGWIAHSQLEIRYGKYGGILLYRTDPFGTGDRRYSDSNRDGILEAVQIETSLFQNSGIEGTFNTNNDLQTHPEVFEMENKLYQQELQEFVLLFQKQHPEKFKQFGLEKILAP